MTRTVEQWLITAPQETFEAIHAVTVERSAQEQRGWTPEHDDEHGVQHLLIETYERLAIAGYDAGNGSETRESLVVVAALLIAAIETHDRKRNKPGTHDTPSGDTEIGVH